MKTGFGFSFYRYFIVSLKIGSLTIDDANANQASQINTLIGREKKKKRVAREARTLERFSAIPCEMTACNYHIYGFDDNLWMQT